MKVTFIKKQDLIDECDCGCAVDAGISAPELTPTIPVEGGPDRWDNILGSMNTQAKQPSMKKFKTKRRKKNGK